MPDSAQEAIAIRAESCPFSPPRGKTDMTDDGTKPKEEMRFRPVEPGDLEWVTRLRDPDQHPFTALSFPSLCTWRGAYGLEIAGDSDFFVIRSRRDGSYFCPCGDPEKCRRFLNGPALKAGDRVLYLTRTQAESLGENWEIRLHPDLSEYIYNSAALALREGWHASHSYRSKCRRFQQQYSYQVRPLSGEDIPLLRSLAKRWDTGVQAEEMPIFEEMAAGFDRMQLSGLLMTAEGDRHALMIGYENYPGMYTISVGMHDPELPPQTTAVCVQELARALEKRYPLINLEEDLGQEGLRRAKMLYSPAGMLDVFGGIRT